MLKWLRNFFWDEIPPPPFRASKGMAVLMNGVWYGYIKPADASQTFASWGLSELEIEHLIRITTEPLSYWSQHDPATEPARKQ